MPQNTRHQTAKAMGIFALAAVAFLYGYLSSGFDRFLFAVMQSSPKHRHIAPSPPVSKTPASPPGFWNRLKPATSSDLAKKFASLPYLAGTRPAPARVNTTIYDKGRAYEGYNLYTSGHAPAAFLIDMEGRLLHSWRRDFESSRLILPDELKKKNGHLYWRRVHLFENGDLLAIFEGLGMIKVDKNSRLLWSYGGGCHHDLFVGETGEIYCLTRKFKIIPRQNEHIPVGEDFLTILDADGRERESWSLLKLIEKSPYAFLLVPVKDLHVEDGLDLLHTNTIEVFDGSHAGRSRLFKKGNILVSFRNINTIAIIDPEKKDLVWAFGPNNFILQHQPTLLANGHMLVFDNRLDFSRVVEFDPLTREFLWEYRGDAQNGFFTQTCGSSQRLPNGNTLITESEKGRAFEVTPKNEIVWEFLSPHRAGENQELVATLFEMIRTKKSLKFLK